MIAILGILASIALINYGGAIKSSEAKVCTYNRKTIEKYYELELSSKDLVHTFELFDQYLNVNKYNCPSDGIYDYVDGKVTCGFHNKDSSDDEVEDEPPVPYL